MLEKNYRDLCYVDVGLLVPNPGQFIRFKRLVDKGAFHGIDVGTLTTKIRNGENRHIHEQREEA